MLRGHPDLPLTSTPSMPPAAVGPWPRRVLIVHLLTIPVLCAAFAGWSYFELVMSLMFVELGPIPYLVPLLWFVVAIPACGILFFRLPRWPTFRQSLGAHALLASLWIWLAALRTFGNYAGP